jgi:hypothetical protein
MKYIPIINGIQNLRFWDLRIVYRENKVFLQKPISGDNIFAVEISVNMLIELLYKTNVPNGFIGNYITFLENDEGLLEPFNSDSPEVKSAMKKAGYCLKPSEIEIGQEIDLFKDTFQNQGFSMYGTKIFYGGLTESKKHKFLIKRPHFDNPLLEIKIVRETKTFPFVYIKYDEFLTEEEINEFPF